jgi:hypothetical protein
MSADTEWAAFFDDHAPRHEDNAFTRNTAAEVAFLADLPPLPAALAEADPLPG